MAGLAPIAVLLGLMALGSQGANTTWSCDPIVPSVCGLPFPNNFFRGADGRLNLTKETFPLTGSGQPIDPDKGGWNDLDGFSASVSLLAYLPAVDISPCASATEINKSLAESSPVVIVDADSGSVIPHWVEMDASASAEQNADSRLMMIWPAVRLEDGHRYVVGLRRLRNRAGQLIQASEAFAAIRDGSAIKDPVVNARRAALSPLFDVTARVGWQRAEHQLLWEFTVQSTRTQTNRMVMMRDDAIRRTAGGIPFFFTNVVDNPSNDISRELHGVMTVPWYLTQAGPGKDTRVKTQQNDTNTPEYAFDHVVDFTVIIPANATDTGRRLPIMQYGHGLFGDQDEVKTGYLVAEASQFGYILVASNWIGMAAEDEPTAALIIAEDLTNFGAIPDRSHQGMLNALMLMRLVSQEDFVNHQKMMPKGVPVIDPARRHYYGNSQGGIFGSVYMALTTDVKRGVLGVPGGPYSLLLPRSADFADLFVIVKARYPDAQTRIMLLNALQLLWNRLGPGGYMHHVSRDLLPNTPGHRVLLHYGLGDAQVTWLGGMLLGRSIGAHMYTSNVREQKEDLFGFEMINDHTVLTGNESLIQGWNFGAPPVPLTNIPPNKKFDAHEKPRRDPRAQLATHLFLTEGAIENTCNGPCFTNETKRQIVPLL